MKQSKNKLFLTLSLVFAFLMLLFTFVTCAWLSDRGLQFGAEIPVRLNFGFLTSLGDVIWMAVPFCLLLSLLLCTLGKGGLDAALLLAPVPSLLSVFIFLLAFFLGNESHLTIFIPLFFVFLLSIFAIASAFEPSLRKTSAALCFFYVGVEILLLVLSFFLQKKFSYYYFFESIYINRTDTISLSYFVISIFLNYISFALSLGFMLLPEEKETRSETEETRPSPEKEEEKEEPEKEDEEDIPLSLEDLGLQR